jgi:hypothetical protein
MSFQAYLDNIKSKTGKTPADFKKLAAKKGLLKQGLKAGEIVNWLKKDFDLGHGHAMAIYRVLSSPKEYKGKVVSDKIAVHFNGRKREWQPIFNSLMKSIREFGDDIHVDSTSRYLSILRGNRKIAVVQVTSLNMYVGIKLRGVAPTQRFEPATRWNNMVTHRVRIANATEIDGDLLNWLQSAYEQNAPS